METGCNINLARILIKKKKKTSILPGWCDIINKNSEEKEAKRANLVII